MRLLLIGRCPVRLLLIAAAMVVSAGCSRFKCATRADASGEDEPRQLPRTPTLTWVFDDRLAPASVPKTGELLAGDELVVVVDSTQRFAGTATDVNKPFFRTTSPAVVGGLQTVFLPPGIRHLYLAGRGQQFAIQPGQCNPRDSNGVDRQPTAFDCTPDAARTADVVHWERTSTGSPPQLLDVYACPQAQASLVPNAGASQVWSLIQKRASAPVPPEKEYACLDVWEFKPDSDAAVDSVTLLTTTEGVSVPVAAVAQDGVWRARAALKAGTVSAEVRIKYKNGLTNNWLLGEFSVQTVDEHALVRVQPEILATRRLRAVNLAVSITPVAREFFKYGPWRKDCALWSYGCWLMNGINPSMVVRFSGENTTLVQFGVGLSVFLNRAMLINGGLLFGSTDATRYWNPLNNYFIGFAIDPVLLMELRNNSGGGTATETKR